MKQLLKIKDLKSLVGETIEWSSPGYRANGHYVGISKIMEVDLSKRNPISSETISGINLNHSFIFRSKEGDLLDELMCFSDSDRHIGYNVVDTEDRYFKLHLKYGWSYKDGRVFGPHDLSEEIIQDNPGFHFEKVRECIGVGEWSNFYQITLKDEN